MIEVVNVKGGRRAGDHYIGRPSRLGNPFPMKHEGQREEVVAKYRVWLWDQIQQKGVVYDELRVIAAKAKWGFRVRLACHCAPKKCHGDVVKAACEWMIREGIV
jgi:hypothetical protein